MFMKMYVLHSEFVYSAKTPNLKGFFLIFYCKVLFMGTFIYYSIRLEEIWYYFSLQKLNWVCAKCQQKLPSHNKKAILRYTWLNFSKKILNVDLSDENHPRKITVGDIWLWNFWKRFELTGKTYSEVNDKVN